MVIIDALWQAVILIEGGKLLLKYCILAFTIRNNSCKILLKKEKCFYFVIFMVTVEEKIYLCMVAMYLHSQKTQDFSLSFCQKYALTFHITILVSVTKNQKKQQQELLCLMNSKSQLFSLWKVLFVEMIKDLILIIISLLSI